LKQTEGEKKSPRRLLGFLPMDDKRERNADWFWFVPRWAKHAGWGLFGTKAKMETGKRAVQTLAERGWAPKEKKKGGGAHQDALVGGYFLGPGKTAGQEIQRRTTWIITWWEFG